MGPVAAADADDAGHLLSIDIEGAQATVLVHLRNDGERLSVRVVDDGVGLAEGFDIDSTTSLGLSIVRSLVESELGGRIELRGAGGAPPRVGTEVLLDLPLDPDANRPPAKEGR